MDPLEALDLERMATLMKAASRQKGQSLKAQAVIRKYARTVQGKVVGSK
jgi:hypothetical protein